MCWLSCFSPFCRVDKPHASPVGSQFSTRSMEVSAMRIKFLQPLNALKVISWEKAIPGLTTALVTVAAPAASFTALKLFPDGRILEVISQPVPRAVMSLYLQIATVFVASLIVIVACITHLSVGATGKLRMLCWCGFFFCGCFFRMDVYYGRSGASFSRPLHA